MGGHNLLIFTRQTDVRKRGHIVSMFTPQSDVGKAGHVVPTFTWHFDVRNEFGEANENLQNSFNFTHKNETSNFKLKMGTLLNMKKNITTI